VTPPGKLGWNTVTVTNPGVGSADLVNGFDYGWIRQQPTRALSLPKSLKANTWTTVARLPLVTNAGERVKTRVTCTPSKSCRLRLKGRYLQVYATDPKRVTVQLTAPAQYQKGYGAYRLEKAYDGQRIRRTT